jgi:hypothetical protein
MVVTVLLLCGLLIAISMMSIDPRSRADRITDACRNEFGALGNGVVIECTVTVLNEWASDLEQEKLHRVYQSAN